MNFSSLPCMPHVSPISSRLTPYIMKLLGIISVGFDVTEQLLILKKEWECNGTIHQLFIDIKKASVRREVLYNILIAFGIPMKPVRLIKICVKKTYSKAHTVQIFSDVFCIWNGLK
jgi:hypothetical protein